MGNCQLLIVSIFIGSLLTIVFYFTFAERSVSIGEYVELDLLAFKFAGGEFADAQDSY